MKKITNPGLLTRNKKIGTFAQIGGMLVLVAGLVFTFFYEYRIDLSYGSLFVGFILVNIGAAYTNKWGRIPPPDQAIDDLLKGLDDRYTIVHFRLGAEHALFTPNGLVALLPKYERGVISFDGKKWRQSGVSGWGKLFGVEALGNPILDAEIQARDLSDKLRKILDEEEVPAVRPLVVFVNEKTRVEVEETPIPVLHASRLKETIRRLSKTPTLLPGQLQRVLESIGETT